MLKVSHLPKTFHTRVVGNEFQNLCDVFFGYVHAAIIAPNHSYVL